tara:strand:+ start:332 stop:3130 length:2799 start_codon:yes stop_codon:yes gene_type:complete
LRLTNIKISGFKSFVDKTEISLSEKRTAIVGPNGCGKSNIIDAVKWVLGETSKHIRGDNIDDVIFNGTDSRKPHDYANVELLFSNTENRIGGQYAQYNEISVKREVTRDGSSKYFLNNSHCRRRDILDIFMGTGLGPKSYAIINQGTASKLIESKPEEFRVYLEEVAGISKYRERKRETENKIKHTKENLERLSDVINEVLKQLKTLERQAIQADKFKKLEEEKKSIKAEILAISIRDFQETIENKNRKIEVKKTKIEKKQAKISNINNEIDSIKDDYQKLSDDMNEIQKEYYDALSEVGRTENAIEYEKKGAERNKQQYESVIESIEKLRERLKSDSDEMLVIKEQIDFLLKGQDKIKILVTSLNKEKDIVQSDLSNEYENFENNSKNLYEAKQKKIGVNEKISNLESESQSLKKDIEENKITSNDILTELEKIESFELEEKIKNYHAEILNYNRLIDSSNNKEIIESSNRIKNILSDIKEIIDSVQANELEIAKKNQKIKDDIDKKVLSQTEKLNSIVKHLESSKSELLAAGNKINEFEEQNEERSKKIETLKNSLQNINESIIDKNEELRLAELNIETQKVQVKNLQNNIDLNNKELEQMTGNIKTFETRKEKPGVKLSELEEMLTKYLEIQNQKDKQLKEVRVLITQYSDKISEFENNKSEIVNELDLIKVDISEDEKGIQEIVGQVKILKEQFSELGLDGQSILDVNIDYDLTKWKKRESELTSALNRMGPINMAAIEQFKEYEERKSYLSMQKDDLLSALSSLEEAIKKIDKDTKERFKNTFEQVDSKLQEIFPKLFNGGKAYLKMTENDLLKTGVVVFASPPGKKLTSINLLSGGEKALTALSLVFALFSLNPSPFCMLDEVDAPLDDANIERFCNLFTEMSEKIQFIVITHKKITMEYVEQLIGVTMGEKGVSKLVNVSMSDDL